jgi:hypothetical protein
MRDKSSFTYAPYLLIASSSRAISLKGTIRIPKAVHIPSSDGDHSALDQPWAVTSSAAPLFAASVILCDFQSHNLLLIDEGKISSSYSVLRYQLSLL